MAEIIGFYIRQNTNPLNVINQVETEDDTQNDLFRQYIWGNDGNGGLANLFKKLQKETYGSNLKLILFQFNVNPDSTWPAISKEVENYSSKEHSIGAWITVTKDNFFSKNEEERAQFIKTSMLNRLETVKERVKANKLDTNMDLLIEDVGKLL